MHNSRSQSISSIREYAGSCRPAHGRARAAGREADRAGIVATGVSPVVPARQDVPRIDGRPDLNGTWYNGDGVLHVRPLQKGASICIRGCDDEAQSPAPACVAAERPTDKPEFLAKVRDLDERQVEDGIASVLAHARGVGGYAEVEIMSARNWWRRDSDGVVRICLERMRAAV